MPLDYRDYPPNWKTEIVPTVLKRADNFCEYCGVPNLVVGYRDSCGFFIPFEYDERFDWIRTSKGIFDMLDKMKLNYCTSQIGGIEDYQYCYTHWIDFCLNTQRSMTLEKISWDVFHGNKALAITALRKIRNIKGVWKGQVLKIVLQIAHLDHNPHETDMDRLAALCQKCHLEYDQQMHLEKRKTN